VVLAFDESEAYRNLAFIRAGGTVIVNSPGTFPDERLRGLLDAQQIRVYTLDANGIAGALGRTTVANVALLGFACACPGFPLPLDAVRELVRQSARPQTLEANLNAFDQGAEAAQVITT
jgi:indolepyruvate ferredoxin oxidoreductase beta subunit